MSIFEIRPLQTGGLETEVCEPEDADYWAVYYRRDADDLDMTVEQALLYERSNSYLQKSYVLEHLADHFTKGECERFIYEMYNVRV